MVATDLHIALGVARPQCKRSGRLCNRFEHQPSLQPNMLAAAFHLSPGRPIIIGRESGDWIFPYDATMSGRHAEVRTEDSEFFVHDANSRNGVAMSVRGERELKKGQHMLVGDQILRLESV